MIFKPCSVISKRPSINYISGSQIRNKPRTDVLVAAGRGCRKLFSIKHETMSYRRHRYIVYDVYLINSRFYSSRGRVFMRARGKHKYQFRIKNNVVAFRSVPRREGGVFSHPKPSPQRHNTHTPADSQICI